MKLSVKFVLVFIGIGLACVAADDELIDDDTNPGEEEGKEIFRNLVRPFRMEKLNLIWVKAQQVNKTQSPLFLLKSVAIFKLQKCLHIQMNEQQQKK